MPFLGIRCFNSDWNYLLRLQAHKLLVNKDGSKIVECFNSRELIEEEGFYYDVYASEAHKMVFREQKLCVLLPQP